LEQVLGRKEVGIGAAGLDLTPPDAMRLVIGAPAAALPQFQ
jgi:hypothetical protein